MASIRDQFSTRFGFLMAAAGSAVGLGNIWGFPTQTANNGGGAFVLVYLLLAFLLAYPALMAELVIGRHARANIVSALGQLSPPRFRPFAKGLGIYGVMVAAAILSFYSIVAGWMIAHFLESLGGYFQLTALSGFFAESSTPRDILVCLIFFGLTLLIIMRGIKQGVEVWSERLMPMLLILMLLLITYVLTQEGANKGLQVYLVPDFSQITNPSLLVSALGQAFFSLSLGVGTMLIYGSYVSQEENLPKLGAMVTLIDVGIAFTAGLLIIPAIYVAEQYGASIYNDTGELLAGPRLIFQVLPTLFESMGNIGSLIGAGFFLLMTIAALTSSISLLEVPVSTLVEQRGMKRPKATILAGSLCFMFSIVIIINFEALFGLVIDVTTKYSEPLIGIIFCLFAGWGFHRNQLLEALKQGDKSLEQSLFWKIWPWYIRVVCPLLILATFVQSLL